MTKIYTLIEQRWDKETGRYITVEEVSYDYAGNLALAKGEQTASQQSSTSGNSTQVSEPWSVQVPYLTQGFQNAQDLFINQKPPQYYPNSTVSPFSPEKETALQLQTTRALTGSPLQPVGNAQALGTMAGAYLPTNNPYNSTLNDEFNDPSNNQRWQDAIGSATRQIIPAVDSSFERSGRFNSGLADTAKTQAVADAYANQYMNDKSLTQQDRAMRGQNFTNERENMMRSMIFSPQLSNNDYADFSQLGAVGDQRDAMGQSQLTDDVNRFNYGQNINQQQLAQYMQLISGNYGGTTTSNFNQNSSSNSTQSGGKSQAAGGIGGALGGFNTASSIGGVNPLFGGALGLLGGLF